MRLALATGQLDVDRLLASISSNQLAEWIAFTEIEGPWWAERGDWQACKVEAAILNTMGGAKVQPSELMPRWGQAPAGRRPKPVEEQMAYMIGLTRAMGGEVILGPKHRELALQITGDTHGLTDAIADSMKSTKTFAQQVKDRVKGTLDTEKLNKSTGRAMNVARYGSAVGGAMNLGAMAAGPAGMLAGGIGAANKFASAANPALGAQLDDAWADLAAAIGTALMPILEATVPLVRLLADAMITLAPAIKTILSPLTWLAEKLRGAGEKLGLKSSVGLAPRQAQFSSAEDFSKRIDAAAFSGPGGTVADQQLTEAKLQTALLQAIKGGPDPNSNKRLVRP